MYYRGSATSMSISSANDTIFSPDLTNYVYWPSSSTYNIIVGNQLFGPELQGRLMAVAIASIDTNMFMYNSGSQGTTLNLVVDVPESPCDGDMNNDRSVGIDDLLEVISGWNDPYGIDELLDVLDGWGNAADHPQGINPPDRNQMKQTLPTRADTMNIIHTTACITLLTLTAPLHAEELVIEIEATNSGRVYADTTFQDCCDLDSFQANETNIPVENCSTQGGYCMSGKKIASWMFPMPELEPGSTVLSATFGDDIRGSTSYATRQMVQRHLPDNAALSGWSSTIHRNVGSSGATSPSRFRSPRTAERGTTTTCC